MPPLHRSPPARLWPWITFVLAASLLSPGAALRTRPVKQKKIVVGRSIGISRTEGAHVLLKGKQRPAVSRPKQLQKSTGLALTAAANSTAAFLGTAAKSSSSGELAHSGATHPSGWFKELVARTLLFMFMVVVAGGAYALWASPALPPDEQLASVFLSFYAPPDEQLESKVGSAAKSSWEAMGTSNSSSSAESQNGRSAAQDSQNVAAQSWSVVDGEETERRMTVDHSLSWRSAKDAVTDRHSKLRAALAGAALAEGDSGEEELFSAEEHTLTRQAGDGNTGSMPQDVAGDASPGEEAQGDVEPHGRRDPPGARKKSTSSRRRSVSFGADVDIVEVAAHGKEVDISAASPAEEEEAFEDLVLQERRDSNSSVSTDMPANLSFFPIPTTAEGYGDGVRGCATLFADSTPRSAFTYDVSSHVAGRASSSRPPPAADSGASEQPRLAMVVSGELSEQPVVSEPSAKPLPYAAGYGDGVRGCDTLFTDSTPSSAFTYDDSSHVAGRASSSRSPPSAGSGASEQPRLATVVSGEPSEQPVVSQPSAMPLPSREQRTYRSVDSFLARGSLSGVREDNESEDEPVGLQQAPARSP